MAKPQSQSVKAPARSKRAKELSLTQPADYAPPETGATTETTQPESTRVAKTAPYDGAKYYVFFGDGIPPITIEPQKMGMFDELREDYEEKLHEGQAELHVFTDKGATVAFIEGLGKNNETVPVVTPVKMNETGLDQSVRTAEHLEKSMAQEDKAQELINKMIAASQKFASAPKIAVYYTSNSYGLGNMAIYIIRVLSEKGDELWSFKPEPMMQCFKAYTQVIPFEEAYLNTLITNMMEGHLRKPGGAPDEIKHSQPRAYKKKDSADGDNGRKYRKTEQKNGGTWPQSAIWTYGPRLPAKQAELMATNLAKGLKQIIPTKPFQSTCENIMCNDPGTFSSFFAAIDNENAKYYSTLWHTVNNIRIEAEKLTMDRWKTQFVTEVVELMEHVHKTGKLYS